MHNESIRGEYIRTDDQGNAESGKFVAILVNSDPSAYVPAGSPAEPSASANASTPPAQPASHVIAVGDPKYRDVHTLAGTVPESLGVGFIGDGTMGAGGMGIG